MADQRSISTKRHILVTGFANTQPFVSRYSTSPGQSTGSSLSGASSGRNSGSSSSASRHPLTRPLSPDLPTRDALYVFSNFSSYMQSPNEGAKGVRTKDGFRDSIRLLDYARSLSASQDNHVSILHLKYRYRSPEQTARPAPGHVDAPTPQPFSTQNDPVIKIDYRENGVFDPLPAATLFSHIAKACQPPPRIIVFAYVGSQVIRNHLASIASWALTSSPPIFVFSPAEARVRERRPLHIALGHAIPISMYAWPAGTDDRQTPPASPIRSRSQSRRNSGDREIKRDMQFSPFEPAEADDRSVRQVQIIRSPSTTPLSSALSSPVPDRPEGPIASLTVYTAPAGHRSSGGSGSARSTPHADRIPLWALAPGVGILHGSTWRGLGVHLSDFSAINLSQSQAVRPARNSMGEQGAMAVSASDFGFRTSPMDLASMLHALPSALVEKAARPLTPASHIPLPNPARPRPLQSRSQEVRPAPQYVRSAERLSAPHQRQRSRSPRGSVQHLPSGFSRSWPDRPAEGLAGWKRGRKEIMEEILEDLGLDRDLLIPSGRGRAASRRPSENPPRSARDAMADLDLDRGTRLSKLCSLLDMLGG